MAHISNQGPDWKTVLRKRLQWDHRKTGCDVPPRSSLLTLSGSQNHRWGPRQFCLRQCFSGSCASDHYQTHLQEQKKARLPSCSRQQRTTSVQGQHSWEPGVQRTPQHTPRIKLSHQTLEQRLSDWLTLGERRDLSLCCSSCLGKQS